MLVFIDESGDAGLKINEGSSPHFVVTLVIFADNAEALKADNCITALKAKMGFGDSFEFHFNKLKPEFRRQFLIESQGFEFQYFSIVINKVNLDGKGFQFPESFYKYTCKLVCTNAKEYLKEATVVIDGSGSREFKMQLANYLKKNINDKKAEIACIKKVKIQDSHRNNLLQLADMVCGAVARSFKDKKDSKSYRKIIKTKEVMVQFWPRQNKKFRLYP